MSYTDEQIENIAHIAHDANRAYCLTLGDTSQLLWDDSKLDEELRKSVRVGVRHVLDNPNVTPVDSHKSWLKFKEDHGWTYGEVKDAIKKTHPCMVSYDQLPESQQKKDKLFQNIVNALR